MPRTIGGGTLRLTLTGGRPLGLACAALVLVLGGAEIMARSDAVQSRLVPPSLGTGIPHLELQLAHIHELVEREGPFHCVFLGSSMVSTGIDPQRFAEAYREVTRKAIRCFNGGLPALPAASAAMLAELHAHLYHPRLIIYATAAPDYAPGEGGQLTATLLAIPWVQYRLGNLSLEGWLVENSYAYRQYLGFRNWMDPVLRAAMRRGQGSQLGMTPEGFLPLDGVGTDLERRGARTTLSPDEVLDGSSPAIVGLTRLLELRRTGTAIVLMEMPWHPSAVAGLKHGEDDHRVFLERISDHARAHHVRFWPTTALGLVPRDGWADRVHMNVRGAEAFSTWLGRRVGKAVRKRDLEDPVP